METLMLIYFAGPIGPPPTPESRAQFLHLCIALLIILVIVSSYWTLKYINPPSYIRNIKIIRVFRFVTPIVSVFVGALAVFYNEGQPLYFLFYTVVPMALSQDALNLWTKHEINIYNSNGARTLSSKYNRATIIAVVAIVILVIFSFGYSAIDKSFTRKRIRNYNQCLRDKRLSHPKQHYTEDPCISLVRKKRGI